MASGCSPNFPTLLNSKVLKWIDQQQLAQRETKIRDFPVSDTSPDMYIHPIYRSEKQKKSTLH